MSNLNMMLLSAIATATAANQPYFVTQAEATPFIKHQPPLIAVDASIADPSDANKRSAQITPDGVTLLQAPAADEHKPAASHATFEVVANAGFARPAVKRGGGGGGGAPTKYPFDTLEVNGIFFVADTEVAKGDAFKTMGSAVGSANQRFSEDTAEMHEVKRMKRDANGKVIKENGKAVTETVTVPVKKSLKKFVVSKVEGGKTYGSYTAPANGAVVLRTE